MATKVIGAVPSARYPLGAIRLFNGALTLFATRPFARRLGVDPDENPVAVYALRLFGVRTVYVGLVLLVGRGDHLSDEVAIAPAIHASDTLAAVALARSGTSLPASSRRMGVAISSLNVVLALLAWQPPTRHAKRSWRR